MLRKSLKDLVFDKILSSKVITTKQLVFHFTTNNSATKQGVYKVLRELKREEKIVWVAKTVHANLVWLQKTIDTLTSYLPSKDFFLESLPKHGAKKIFRTKTLNSLEQLYSQLFVATLSSNPDERQFLFYDMHNHTYLSHVPLVDWYINYISKRKSNWFLLVGSDSPLDLALRKKMKSSQVHCTNTKHFNCYLSIIGDYVISAYLDKKVFQKIDLMFIKENIDQAKLLMKEISEEKGVFKIVLENNKERAEKVRKVFRKYFHLPIR